MDSLRTSCSRLKQFFSSRSFRKLQLVVVTALLMLSSVPSALHSLKPPQPQRGQTPHRPAPPSLPPGIPHIGFDKEQYKNLMRFWGVKEWRGTFRYIVDKSLTVPGEQYRTDYTMHYSVSGSFKLKPLSEGGTLGWKGTSEAFVDCYEERVDRETRPGPYHTPRVIRETWTGSGNVRGAVDLGMGIPDAAKSPTPSSIQVLPSNYRLWVMPGIDVDTGQMLQSFPVEDVKVTPEGTETNTQQGCGGSLTSDYAGGGGFMVANIALPTSDLILKGSAKPYHTEPEEKQEGTVTWELSPDTEDWEVVVDPVDYEKWIPEGGVDEVTEGKNTLTIKATLRRKDGKKPDLEAKKFTFELLHVSHEPGVCMNWPPKNVLKNPSPPDLQFVKDEKHNQDPTANITKEGHQLDIEPTNNEASAVVSAYDWGAYGELQVTAEMPTGKKIVGHLKDGDNGRTNILLPKRSPDSHIADAWKEDPEIDAVGLADDSDEDDLPQVNDHKGDGLSLYEEYRGFHVNGEHIRTNPHYKDLFVYNEHSLPISLFTKESKITVHVITSREFFIDWGSDSTNQNVINFNHGWAHNVDQHALWLRQEGGLYEKCGRLYGVASEGHLCGRPGGAAPPPGPPKTVWRVLVDRKACESKGKGFLENTVAHELAHAVGVFHHGDNDIKVTDVKVTNAKGDGTGPWDVAVRGGQESGVQNCIMRYNESNFYEVPNAGLAEYVSKDSGGKVRFLRYYGKGGEPLGTIFCASDVDPSPGVNAEDYKPYPKAGNATNGDCRHRFRVSDATDSGGP